MRRIIEFGCAGETLVGTIDAAAGSTGLLIASGGNEIRCGAHRGMAQLATRLAGAGAPVFRFDRRGVGDSTGENTGFEGSGPDIAAAVWAFRAAVPHVDRLVGFGNCDAASALILHAGHLFDRVVLANPWTIEDGEEQSATLVRSHYRQRLWDGASWRRLLAGKVSMSALFRSLSMIVNTEPKNGALARRVFAALAAQLNHHVILAARDRTALAFADAARRASYRGPVTRIDTASHSFACSTDQRALEAVIRAELGLDR